MSIHINRSWLNDSVVSWISRRTSDATHLDMRNAEQLQVKQVNAIVYTV